ncbi:MAG: hypothetical protein SGI97_08570, partial [candidate division Zixibacteria bacterium]|nr:hypothetical protein [candidate division Zixibacteria bacterium]
SSQRIIVVSFQSATPARCGGAENPSSIHSGMPLLIVGSNMWCRPEIFESATADGLHEDEDGSQRALG